MDDDVEQWSEESRSPTPTSLSSRVKARLESLSTRNDSQVLCEHCVVMITVKTYRRHYRLYFKKESGEWNTAKLHKDPTF